MDKDKAHKIAVRGVLLPTSWKQRDGAIDAMLYGHDESEYLVAATAMGLELLRHCRRPILARGAVEDLEELKELGPRRIIHVTDFQLLDPSESAGI